MIFFRKQKENIRNLHHRIEPNRHWVQKLYESMILQGSRMNRLKLHHTKHDRLFSFFITQELFFAPQLKRKHTYFSKTWIYSSLMSFRDAPTQGRLQVGPFIVSPAFAMIMPGGNASVSVECLPESDVPRKFEEVKLESFSPSDNFFVLGNSNRYCG